MNILVLLMSGIGNTLMFTPALRLLKKAYPHADIDALVMHKGSKEILENNPYLNKIIFFPFAKKGYFSSFLFMLRFSSKNRYGICLTAFPSNQREFNVPAFLSRAKKRLTHSYPKTSLSTLSFLQNKKIKAIENISDIEQNINLLSALGIDKPKKMDFKLDIFLKKDEKEFAHKFTKQLKHPIIGMHAGSGTSHKKSYSFENKRWPKKNFIELINLLNKNKKCSILLFGGPEELELNKEIKGKNGNVTIVQEELRKTAALISKCDFFISSDTGLMHIAEAFDIPLLALFGPTNYFRTQPLSKRAVIIKREMNCSPCFTYPFKTTKASIKCSDVQCLSRITPHEVYSKYLQFSKRK